MSQRGSLPVRGPQQQKRILRAALAGVAAGLLGIFICGLLFGSDAAPFGIALGAVALIGGTFMSWRSHHKRQPAGSPYLPSSLGLHRRVHPVDWIGPFAAGIITMAAWAGVAHTSGSGSVQAVGALIGAFLLIGLIAPIVPARRAHVTCTHCPTDGTAGTPIEFVLSSDRPVRIRPIYPHGPILQTGGKQRGSRTTSLTITPHRRGLLDSIVVEVGSSAPFGLLWWARDVELPLPRLLHIAPRTGPSDARFGQTDHATGEAAPRVPSGLGEPRGVRPYTSGDPRRAVHWPATSHSGMLMIREAERPSDDPFYVTVTLPRDRAAAEAEAERIMAGVTTCLARHQVVILATDEADGPIVRPVSDRVELGRRLARAVST